MAPRTRFLPLFALLASPVAAQSLITPLEQDRHLSITVSGASAGAQAAYVLESHAETFDPFYAGITGELTVETSRSYGIGGHYSLIRPNSFIIEQSTNAEAEGMVPDDMAATLTDCTFRVLFAVQRRVRFTVSDLWGTMEGPGASAMLTLTDAAGFTIFAGLPNKSNLSYPSSGVLVPGDYMLEGTSIVGLGTTGDQEVMGHAALAVTFEVELVEAACPCDWNFDGRVSSEDLFAFLADFLAYHADFDGSGRTDSADLFAFMTCVLMDCD